MAFGAYSEASLRRMGVAQSVNHLKSPEQDDDGGEDEYESNPPCTERPRDSTPLPSFNRRSRTQLLIWPLLQQPPCRRPVNER